MLCLFLTAIIGIGTPLVGDRVFLGADLLQVYSPWRTHTSVTAEQHLIFSDTVDFYTPQRIIAAKALRAGELPWWNPYPAGGTPLASIPDTAVLSTAESAVVAAPRVARARIQRCWSDWQSRRWGCTCSCGASSSRNRPRSLVAPRT